MNTMEAEVNDGIGAVLGRVPSGLFVLTSQYEGQRRGMLASWVQQVCFEPALVSVAVGKSRSILPMIRDSRHFGLCQLPRGDKAIMRRFAGAIPPDEDPFLGLDTLEDTASGCPILANSMGYMECRVTHHMDVDGDHDLFVGAITAGRMLKGECEPHVHLRENGFRY